MRTTFLNPGAVEVAVALVAALGWGRRGLDQLWRVACRPAVVAALALIAMMSIGSRIMMGYFVPGDLAQEIVAEARFDTSRTLYPDQIVADIQRWMDEQPPPFENRLPKALQTRLQAERAAQARLYSAQAHPPFLLLCTWPLVQLCGGYGAFLVITTLTVAATTIGAALLADWAGIARFSGAWWLVVVLALAWQPTLAATRHGQVSAVISALLIGAWALARRGRDIAAGAAVGVAAALKVYPVIFLLFFLVRRPRACAVAAATLLSTTALVIAIAGLANLRAYMVSASAIAARYGTTGNNYSLVSRLGLIGLGQSPWPAIAAAVLLLATLAALLAVRDDGQHTFDHEAAACVCLVLLASPIAWQHYFFVLLLPVFVAGRAAYRHGSRWSLGLWLAGLLAISVPDAPYWWVVTHVAPRIPPAALLLSPTIAMLAAWAWGLRRVDYA